MNARDTAVWSGPLVHVGYHKTGTTWFQTRFFDDSSSGFLLPWSRADQIDEWIVLPKQLHFDPAAARAHFENGLSRARAEGRIAVISHERLSGNCIAGARQRSRRTAAVRSR